MASGCHSAASSLARQHYSTERFGRQPSHTINWESGHFTSHVQPEGIPNEHQTVVVQTHRAHITAPQTRWLLLGTGSPQSPNPNLARDNGNDDGRPL